MEDRRDINEIVTVDLTQATGGTGTPSKPKRDASAGERTKELTDDDLQRATGGMSAPIDPDAEE